MNRTDKLITSLHEELIFKEQEINRLNSIINKAIKCINYYALEDVDYSKIYNQEEIELLKILKEKDND